MGLRPTQGDGNCFGSATAFNGSVTLPVPRVGGPTRQTSAQPGRAGTQLRNIAERRRCGTARADLSWKCFSTEESWAFGPPKEMKNRFHSATALYGSATLPFVIPSEAEGSAVQRASRGNVFRQSGRMFSRVSTPTSWCIVSSNF
jgi:hypothetical protein